MADLEIEKKIKSLAKQKDISIRQLCQKIEMSEQGLSSTFKNNTLKIETLLKISEVLQVDICYFFGNESETSKIENNELIKIIKTLIDNEFLEIKKYLNRFSKEIEKRQIECLWSDLITIRTDNFSIEQIEFLKNIGIINPIHYEWIIKVRNYPNTLEKKGK